MPGAMASERVEGDEEAWNAYLDEVANAKPRGCILIGDERGVGPFGRGG